MSFFPSISQNVQVDAINSVAGATVVNYVNPADIWHYNGLGTSTSGVNAIQLVVASTKNLTIYVDQGNANNAFQLTDTYSYLTTQQFGITVQAVGTYVRVRIKNTSGASATVTLDTVLCPIVEALPRSLDVSGHLQVATKSNEDKYGFEAEYSPQGDMRVVSPIRLAGTSFDGPTLDPNFWSTILINGATVSQINGRVDVLTNTSANGSATLFSVRKARYLSGASNLCTIKGRVGDTGTADNIRQWGAGLGSNYTLTITSASVVAGDVYTDINGTQFTVLVTATSTTIYVFASGAPASGTRTYTRVAGTGPGTLTGSGFAANSTITDGFFFQLSGAVFSAVTVIGGSPIPVNSGDFNGNVGAAYAPIIGVTEWEIYFNTKTVWFCVDGVLLHSVSNPLTPLSNTLSLHPFVRNVNSNGSTSAVAFYLRSASIKRLGLLNTESISKYITTATTTVCKYSAGRLKRVIVGDANLNAGDFTLYDGLSASASIIGVINIPKGPSANPFTLEFDLPFHYGLTVVNAVACRCTVVYE